MKSKQKETAKKRFRLFLEIILGLVLYIFQFVLVFSSFIEEKNNKTKKLKEIRSFHIPTKNTMIHSFPTRCCYFYYNLPRSLFCAKKTNKKTVFLPSGLPSNGLWPLGAMKTYPHILYAYVINR